MVRKNKRLGYVDMFRGLPVLLMVLHQIFDVLWIGSIYVTAPYFVSTINSTTWYPWGYIFAFVSGMSAYLLFTRKAVKSTKTAFWSIFKRYGIYILISLPFTWLIFGVDIFLKWEEVLQGIGLGAIVLALYLTIAWKWPKWIHWLVIAVVSLGREFLLKSVPVLDNLYPRITPVVDFGNFLVSEFLNMTLRGWFSILNYFPFMLGGALFLKMYQERHELWKLYVYSAIPLAISVILHFAGIPIDHNGRSFALTFYGIGQTAIFTTVLYHLYVSKKKISNIFYVLGRAAIVAYLAHFVIIIKPVQLLAWADKMGEWQAWIIAIILTALLYLASRWYLKARKIPNKLF